VIFLAKLNQLEFSEADVGNVNLESLAIIRGPEFGDLAGHTLLLGRFDI
jgi:hypothetical protein